jgi:hypothetical protein
MTFNAMAEQITNIAGMGKAIKATPKAADIRADMPETPEPAAGDEPGRDGFDRSLRAAARVFRDSMLLGYGRDETGFTEYFKANSDTRRKFYALMAEYQSFEAIRLAERFSK